MLVMLLLVLLLGLQYFFVVFCLWDVCKNYVSAKNTGFGLWNVCTSSVSVKKILFLVFWGVCKNSVSAKKRLFFLSLECLHKFCFSKTILFFVFGMFAQVLLQQKMTAIPANLKSEMGMGEDEDLAK